MQSFSELLETDSDAFLDQLNTIMHQIEVDAEAIRKARQDEDTSVNDGDNDLFNHLVVMHGSSVEFEDAIKRFSKGFGNVRAMQIDASTSILIFSSELYALRAIRAGCSNIKSPLNLCTIDDSEFCDLDFVNKHADLLEPTES